jgi:hypothetical protein
MDSFPNLKATLSPVAEDIHKTFFSDVTKYYQVNTTRQKLYVEMVKYMAFWFHHKLKDPNYLSNYPNYGVLTGTLAINDNPPQVSATDAVDMHPNPFNPSLTIKVHPALVSFYKGEKITAAVYDVSGRLVQRLNASSNAPGQRELTYVWNAGNRPSGVYMVQVRAGDKTYSRKVTYLR